MKLTIQEIINNAIYEMQRATETIKDLYEAIGEPIGTAIEVTDDELLIEDMTDSIERLQTIPYTILVSLCAAVYAGQIEAKEKGFVNDFGADSLSHLQEYLSFAEQYDLPYDGDNDIDIECIREDVDYFIRQTYENACEEKEEF